MTRIITTKAKTPARSNTDLNRLAPGAKLPLPRSVAELETLLAEHDSPIGKLLFKAATMQAGAPSTYVILDTETSGLSAQWDQITQFAAIRTNSDFEVEHTDGDIVDLRCRLRPEIIPSPGALITTRTFPSALDKAPLSHSEMMLAVDRFLAESTPAIMFGHNIQRFDSEHIRHNQYAALLPAYVLHQNGSRVVDTMLLARLIHVLDPASMNWRMNAKGAVSFKLGDLARANGIAFDEAEAHDALADCQATLALLRVMKAASPLVFALGLALANKQFAADVLNNHLVAGLIGNFGSAAIEPICKIVTSAINRNAVHVAKLTHPILEFLFDPDSCIKTAMTGPDRIICRVKCNGMPLLIPVDPDDPLLPLERVKRHGLDSEDWFQRVSGRSAVRILPDLHAAIHQAEADLADQRPASKHEEEQLYAGGFVSDADYRVCRQMLAAAPTEKIGFLIQIRDMRLMTFALRQIYSVAPETLTQGQRGIVEDWLRARLMSEDPADKWMSIPKALDEIAAIQDGILMDAAKQARERIPHAPPLGPDDRSAFVEDYEGQREVEVLRDQFIQDASPLDMAILEDFRAWLHQKMKALDPDLPRRFFARRLAAVAIEA